MSALSVCPGEKVGTCTLDMWSAFYLLFSLSFLIYIWTNLDTLPVFSATLSPPWWLSSPLARRRFGQVLRRLRLLRPSGKVTLRMSHVALERQIVDG
ncbi:uncharacterized protein EI97DRAFT_107561 [Westerdykella ornata]|uniref:Uncharacterized protein n=1 Tax=Westerdykella ornata TaxID=318751 RepID=A0A6A6JW80_WESOR|nr:uncharacterized protein EI97DRAFT_107561 [Westerdykella ornata]KAF2279996.1 hypothetical protein EI97DRAFT_107561 [Westerdykella ornata]